MKILFIAPLPPPITGHSLVSKVLYDALNEHHDVSAVDLSKDSFKEGVNGVGRIVEVLDIIKKVRQHKKNTDVIYLTISESLAGNIKDLVIYAVCYSKLSRMYIHLHGGSIKKLLWDKYGLVYSINKFFIKKLGGIIISGKSHYPVFDNIVDRKKIHIVPNFALDDFFCDQEEITTKYTDTNPLKILYISGMIEKKGYNELADASFLLSDDIKKSIQIDFAGRFDSDSSQAAFVDKISPAKQLSYHGVIDDATKKRLFKEAHIFCLPTSYFEGQPISILEAYASGCIVLTTGQDGIKDIFEDKVNGFEIRNRSKEAVAEAITNAFLSAQKHSIAKTNRDVAGVKYRTGSYNTSIRSILENTQQV